MIQEEWKPKTKEQGLEEDHQEEERYKVPKVTVLNEDFNPPLFDQDVSKFWVVDMRIGAREDGSLNWEPIRIQVEVAQENEAALRKEVASSFPAALVAQPFKWLSQGVILLSVLINGRKARPIYDPGCVGVALSKMFSNHSKIIPTESVTMKIFGYEGASTLEREIF